MYYNFKLLILLTFSLLLSACVEPGSDVRTYCRSDTVDPDLDPVKVGDILRKYTPLDEIQYSVTGVANTVPVTGTLIVDWNDHAPLQTPVSNSAIITVLEEVAALNVGAITSTTYRYIEQNAAGSNKGEMFLWAYGDASNPNTFYWTNDNEALLSQVQKISLFDSPIDTVALTNAPIVKDIKHYPMLDCASNNNGCLEKFASFVEKDTTTRSTIVETIKGTFFEAYEIEIDSSTIVTHIGTKSNLPFPTPLDFRSACSNGALSDSIRFNGKMWMFPQVGIVKYAIECISAQGFYNLTYNLKNINILLPASKSGDQNSACN